LPSTESLRGREVILARGAGCIAIAVTEALLGEGARLIVGFRSNRERAIRFSLEPDNYVTGQVLCVDGA